jgi:hypothetical protein
MNSEPHAEQQGMTRAVVVRAFIAESSVLCSPGNAGDAIRIEEAEN